MVLKHPLQCRCGTIKGFVDDPKSANRGVCYCKDCQAFAHFLGQDRDVLDERGGTDVIQVNPGNISFMQGTESLACVRLSEKGMLRWYAACCKTPIGNTLASPKISFIGLVHTCLETAGQPVTQSFGPVRAWVNTQSAIGEPKPKSGGMAHAIGWFLRTILKARLTGTYKRTPFFNVASGLPIVSPQVLSSR